MTHETVRYDDYAVILPPFFALQGPSDGDGAFRVKTTPV